MPVLEMIPLTTASGELECSYFESSEFEKCLLIVRRPLTKPTFVRLHSACMFSESLHTIDCDCASQLDASIVQVAKDGGVIVYLFQEGRGLGLLGKMQAIRKQLDGNIDTATAFQELGHPPDIRNYRCAAEALHAIGIQSPIRLATNNPEKIAQLKIFGYEVHSREELEIQTNPEMDAYLQMKKKALKHL